MGEGGGGGVLKALPSAFGVGVGSLQWSSMSSSKGWSRSGVRWFWCLHRGFHGATVVRSKSGGSAQKIPGGEEARRP